MPARKFDPRRIPAGAPGHPKTSSTEARSQARPKKGGRFSEASAGDRSAARRPSPYARDEDEAGKERTGRPPRGPASEAGSPPRLLVRGRPNRPSASNLVVLYEDDELVAVDKPAGLPVIAAEGSRSKSLYDIVTAYIRIKHPKGRAAVVHRLDRESSGALVFAKSSRAKTAVMSHWNELAKERVYHALVEGEIAEDKGRLDSWLVEAGPSRMRVAEPGERLALHAITEYRVIGRGGGYSLLSLSLETGRKHQIRVQLAAMGHPIAGDEKYGSRKDPVGRLCLHAVLLVLEHPFTGQLLRIECAPPPEFAAALARKPRPARPEKPRRDPGDSFVGPFGSPLGSAEGKADSLERKRPKARASAPDASPSASPRAGKNAVPPRRPSHRDAKPSKKR